jgi:hypothetical protein
MRYLVRRNTCPVISLVMKKVLLFLLASLVCSSCSSYHSKENLWFTFPIDNAPSLTIQWYHVGILNNLTSSYLTDSATFRLYLGTFDEESEIIAVQAKGDHVMVQKRNNGRNLAAPQPVHETVYSLAKLRQEHTFE